MIAIGCDHGGLNLKKAIIKYLEELSVPCKDLGTYTEDSCDYPDIAKTVADSILKGECDKGILVCGTGIGMSIAANKIKGIRAAVCGDTFSAKMTRVHNNANILCLGARVIGEELAVEILNAFLSAEFESGGRHERRVNKIIDAENGKF